MKKEVSVICWHFSVDSKNGYNRAFELYKVLSQKYKINVIVPRELDVFSDKINVTTLSMNIYSISPSYIQFDGLDYWGFYNKISSDEQLRVQLKALCNNSEYIICDSVYFVSFAKSVFPDKKIIFRSLDIEYDKQIYAYNYLTHDKALVEENLEGVVKYEKKAYADADLVFTLTQADSERLSELYGIDSNKMKVLPLCYSKALDYEGFIPMTRKKTDIIKGMIISYMDLDYTNDLIEIAKRNANMEFHIIGKCCSAFKTPLKNIILYGIISDEELRKVSQKCDFALNISHMTYGVNVKTMDYFTLGIPVLANDLATRGYNVQPYVHYFPADFNTIEEDIQKFFKLNENERYKLSSAAFKHICESYNYEKYIEEYGLSIYDDCYSEYEYYIFGAGISGERTFNQLKFKNQRCIGFVDNNISKAGKFHCGVEIFSPNDIFRIINQNPQKYKLIVSVARNNVKDVLKQVIKEVNFNNIMLFDPYSERIFSSEELDKGKIINM